MSEDTFDHKILRYNRDIATLSQTASRNIVRFTVMIAASAVIAMLLLNYWLPDPLFFAGLIIATVMFAGGWIGVILNAMQFDQISKIRRPLEPIRIEQTVTPTRIAIRRDRSVNIGKFELTPTQWRAIVAAMSRNQWKFTRAGIAKAGAFKSLTKRFPEIRDEFLLLDLIYEDENESYHFTEHGKEKLSEAAGLRLVNGGDHA